MVKYDDKKDIENLKLACKRKTFEQRCHLKGVVTLNLVGLFSYDILGLTVVGFGPVSRIAIGMKPKIGLKSITHVSAVP